MDLSIDESEGVQLVRISGEFDTFAAERFREKLGVLRSTDRFVIDLSSLSFIDSAGVHALFGVGRVATDVGAAMVFVVPPASPVRRVIELVDLAEFAPVCDSLEAAFARLAA